MSKAAEDFMPATAPEIVPRYGRWELSIIADRPPPTAKFFAMLTSPSGGEFMREGYWDGGAEWRVRFMPGEVGQWKWRTFPPPYDGPHGREGTFQCVPVDGPDGSAGRFDRHGPIRVAASGHYLEHADGTPFFYLADTAWNGALLSDEADWDAYLADRAAKGFTAIQFLAHAPWVGAYSNAEGEVAYTASRQFPINPHFFRRIDHRIDAINRHGLLAVPVLLWAAPFGGKEYNAGIALDERQRIALARYQVARYGAHQVMWVLAGDGWYEGWRKAGPWKRIGRQVFRAKSDGTDAVAPVAMHPCGFRWPYGAFAGEKWLDVLGYQSSHSSDARTLRWLQTGPPSQSGKMPAGSRPRPVMNLEPCYEGLADFATGKPFTANDVRRAVYWSVLNGPPAGVAYGAHGVWSWETSTREPLNHPGTGPARPWVQAMHLPGAEQVGHLAKLLAGLRWWELRPAGELLAHQPGEQDPSRFVSVARSTGGEVTLCYLPAGGTAAFRPGAVAADARAEWFDPRTGERRPATNFAAPDGQDWILLLS